MIVAAPGVLESILPDPGTLYYQGAGLLGYPTIQRNNLGQIVARTKTGGVLFYDPLTNAWTDITSTIDGLGTGTISTIQGFNDEGQFVGLVRPPAGGGSFGYVVSPVPEPSSVALLLAAGCLAFGTNASRRRRGVLPSKDSAKPVARSARGTRM